MMSILNFKVGDHAHVEDDEVIARSELGAAMKDSIRADPTRPIKRVYDAVVLERNVSVDNCPMYHTVRSQLARCRASVLPDVPHHINDVDIFDEWARTWNGKQFCSFQDNAWGILVFCTSKSCKMLQRCKIMYIDGTFRTAPEPYMQFVTIHGFYGDRVIPFVFCLLMENRLDNTDSS
jgi:hypothetical protein